MQRSTFALFLSIVLLFINNWLDDPATGLMTLHRNIATKLVYTARF